MIVDPQFFTSASQLECALMPVEPEAWYCLTLFHPHISLYEDMSLAKGEHIDVLHQIMDRVKSTDAVRCFIWIERLTDLEAMERGL